MPDLYRILEVHRKASYEVIEKAYKVLSLKYHPDRHPPEKREWAEAKMSHINNAYDTLSDPLRRSTYDTSDPNSLGAKAQAAAERANENDLLRVLWKGGLIGVAQTLLADSQDDRDG